MTSSFFEDSLKVNLEPGIAAIRVFLFKLFLLFINQSGVKRMGESIRALCEAPAGKTEILQGNIAFAVGCVRGGVHAADGYPGTPSSEVIDRGLSQVQDLIHVNWSVNEAVASAVGMGHPWPDATAWSP
jgi:hypothetical protein